MTFTELAQQANTLTGVNVAPTRTTVQGTYKQLPIKYQARQWVAMYPNKPHEHFDTLTALIENAYGYTTAMAQTQATIEELQACDEDLWTIADEALGYEKTTDETGAFIRLAIQVSTYTWLIVGDMNKVISYVAGNEYSEPLPDEVENNLCDQMQENY